MRPLHEAIRIRMPQVQRLLSGGALAALTGAWMHASPAYPPYWDAAVAVLILALGMWSPLAAWWLAGLAALYGVYHISFYLAVLGLCILILAQRPAARHLGAAALILASPLLARWHLGWAAPLFGGVYLGTTGGLWTGVLAALWGETLAALHGYAPDFLLFAAQPWSVSTVAARFTGLNSWRTLAALGAPFAPDPTALLYHVLQIALWGAAGALTGKWLQANPKGGRPSGVLLAALGGAVSLGILQGATALWLGQHPKAWFVSRGGALLFPMLLSPLAIVWLEVLRDFFARPLPTHLKKAPSSGASPRPAVSFPVSREIRSEGSSPEKNDDDGDLIMLELD